MSILVTGGTGSVGIHLLNLLDGEKDVYSFSAKPPHEWQKLPHVHYVEGDLLDYQKVLDTVKAIKPSAVYHLASQSNVGISFKKPLETLSLNILGTQNLLEAVRKTVPTAKILLLSSSDVYGRGEGFLDIMQKEDAPLRPLTPFATSKASMELLAHQYRESWKMQITIARPFNYAGPFQADYFVLPNLAAQLVRIAEYGGEPILYTGNLDISRDFLDLRDVARALVLILNKGESGEAYNVCSGKIRTVRELVEIMIEKCGIDVEIRHDPSRYRKLDQPLLMGAFDKLREVTGWKPLIDIEDSVEDVYLEMRRRLRNSQTETNS